MIDGWLAFIVLVMMLLLGIGRLRRKRQSEEDKVRRTKWGGQSGERTKSTWGWEGFISESGGEP